MYCRNCGAVVTGKYCCCCGVKLRNLADEYKLAVRAEKKKFKESHRSDDISDNWHFWLAQQCWELANMKYGTTSYRNLPPEAFDDLPKITEHAQKLFDLVVDF